MNSRLFLWIAIALFCLASPAAAQQQGFALDRLQLAPTPEDGLALQLPSTLGPGRWSARLALGYQRDPLVSGGPLGDVVVVQDHVAARAAFALGLGERFEVFAAIPVTLAQTGEDSAGSGLTYPEPDSAGLGDVAVGGSVHLLGAREQGFQLGMNAALLLPTGSTDALSSDGEVGGRGTLTAALAFEHVTFAIEGGAAYRPERRHGFIDSGSELLMRAGAYVPVQRFRLMAELNGSTRLGDGQTFEEVATPLEALLGGEYALASGLRFGLGGGAGLTLGTGAPAFRVLGVVGYAGPREAHVAATDADGDGLADAHDRCPAQPEDRNGFEDDDGCPDAARDGDRDGIADATDRCREQAEDANGYQDADGCPDAAHDADGDGVPDSADACAREAEDRDGVQDDDGCPDADLDTDADGVRDPEDRCPAEPETANGIDDQDGCPDAAPVAAPPPPPPPPPAFDVPAESARFGHKSATLPAAARPWLQAVLAALKKDPQLSITIEGHASEDGAPEYNQQLSEQRANAVARWLMRRGIAKERLEVLGAGTSRPVVAGDTEEARSSNRRVEVRRRP